MSKVGDLLKQGWEHAKKSRQLAIESQWLAGESMLAVSESYTIAASARRMVIEAVKPFDPMEAARPYLELAQLNAELAESYANDAEKYAQEVRHLYKPCKLNLMLVESPPGQY